MVSNLHSVWFCITRTPSCAGGRVLGCQPDEPQEAAPFPVTRQVMGWCRHACLSCNPSRRAVLCTAALAWCEWRLGICGLCLSQAGWQLVWPPQLHIQMFCMRPESPPIEWQWPAAAPKHRVSLALTTHPTPCTPPPLCYLHSSLCKGYRRQARHT